MVTNQINVYTFIIYGASLELESHIFLTLLALDVLNLENRNNNLNFSSRVGKLDCIGQEVLENLDIARLVAQYAFQD